MPSRKYITDPSVLLAQGRLIVSSTDDAEYQHRVEMVNLVLGGLTPSFLSKFISESKETVTRWVKTADEKGFEALKVRKSSGRPPKLNEEQLQMIKTVLVESEPQKYGYMEWNGISLSDYINKKFSVKISIRQCQRLFHRLGFSLIRPQTFPSMGENNKEEREEFKKT